MRAVVIACGLLVAGPALGEGIVFRWVDARGNLHLTDELADVPEPYYSAYRAQLRDREGARARQPAQPPAQAASRASAPTSAAPAGSVIEQEAERRRTWKALVAKWRQELTGATSELARLDEELGRLAANPLLRETGPTKARMTELEVARARAIARLEAARRMLVTELPARAKKEGVPPAWLM